MPQPINTESRRMTLALLAVVLLIAGAILGHPEMSVADNCTGTHEIGCSTNPQCDAFCAALTDAIPCVSVSACYGVAGLCDCQLQP